MTKNMMSKLQQWYFNKIRMPDIDISALQRRCTMSEDSYKREMLKAGADVVETENVYNYHKKVDVPGYYIFQDNHADILAVAHLDTVLPEMRGKFASGRNKEGKRVVRSTALDDRLGAYIILDYLPLFGLRYDVLLCTNEEIGQSTAKYFKTEKQYRWIFEFDRAGKDLVMYEYHNDDMDKICKEFFDVDYGSFTDICELTHLNASAMNIGTGYQSQHTPNCHVVLDDTRHMVKSFLGFYNKYKDVTLPFKLVSRRSWSGGWSQYDDDYNDYGAVRTQGKYKGGVAKPKRTMVIDFISWTYIPSEFAVTLEFENFEVVDVHKHWLPIILDKETRLPDYKMYVIVENWWSNLKPDERNKYIEKYLSDPPEEDTPIQENYEQFDELIEDRCDVCGRQFTTSLMEIEARDTNEGICPSCEQRLLGDGGGNYANE